MYINQFGIYTSCSYKKTIFDTLTCERNSPGRMLTLSIKRYKIQTFIYETHLVKKIICCRKYIINVISEI